MTDPGAPSTPAGWFADTATPGLMRWWDGFAWTDHTAPAAPATAPPGMTLTRPALPADRPVYSPFIWLIALLPLLVYASFFAYQPSLDYSSLANGGTPRILGSYFGVGYFVLIGSSWVSYALTAIFAWRDVVWLRRQGVVRPFAWPWVFLSSIVYLIGRSVIVYGVAKPRGRGPIWAFIAVTVVGFVVVTIWTVLLFQSMFSGLAPVVGDLNQS